MRSRIARMSLVALAMTLPLLIGGAAHADEESGEEVVFSGGGLLGVACGATPSVGTVSVPAESTLRVVNQTGYKAKLILDGVTQGEVGKGEAAKILFHRGPVTLALKPNCVLTEESAAVRVSVRTPARPAPPPVVAAAPAPDLPAPDAAPPAAPGPPPPASTTRRSAPGDPRPAPATTATSAPSRTTPGGTPASASAPATAGTAGPSQSALPDPLALPLDPGTTTVAAEGVAAEAVASVDPVQETGPIGLLALIATICVIGVSAGAIRAIIAQRAARSVIA